MDSEGLSFDLTILMVFSSLLIPSRAKYSHCTGMMTLSAAVSAFTVMSPRLGLQSMRM